MVLSETLIRTDFSSKDNSPSEPEFKKDFDLGQWVLEQLNLAAQDTDELLNDLKEVNENFKNLPSNSSEAKKD